MPVRRRTADSDEEDGLYQQGTPSSKRARRSDAQEPSQHHVNDSHDHVAEDNEDEEKQFEDRYVDKVRHAIETKKQLHGKVAQHGIIQSLEMHQFMCHPRLSFTFGPQINFIIGHNGSGKSAVLSAITVALGGKAITTGRGSGLRSFIREGQPMSEVTITIKNEGEEAYRPDVYGAAIVITRRFSKDGSSSYKIKSKDGKVVSTTRAELSAICDHMNIQVDNPMNVLSQDSARQFLSASRPQDKYIFFLKGTQLSQLSEEYQRCLEDIGGINKILNTRRELIPDLRNAVTLASNKYRMASKAREQQGRIEELKKELSWAHVKEKANELSAKTVELAKAERRIPKVEQNLEEAKTRTEQANIAVVRLENELAELGAVQHLERRKRELQEKLKVNKEKLQEFSTSERSMGEELERCKRAIAGFTARIEEESSKLQDDKKEQRAERERKLAEAKQVLEDHEAHVKEINEQMRVQKGTLDGLKLEINTEEASRDKAMETMNQCAKQIDMLDQQLQNRLVPFGNQIIRVIELINAQHWHGEKPKGPIGEYVFLKDPQWAMVMRMTLGTVMSAFVVTEAQDVASLRKILNGTNNHRVQIILAQFENFDYRRGEPPDGQLTVLRALNITDEHVKRVLINHARIEQTLLAKARSEGQAIVNSFKGGAVAWTADYFRVQAYGDGGMNSQRIAQVLKRDDPRMLLFAHGDVEARKQEIQAQGRQADQGMAECIRNLDRLKAEMQLCRQTWQKLDTEARSAHRAVKDAKDRRDALLNEHNEDVPVDILALEEARAEAEASLESIVRQFTDLIERKRAPGEENRPLLEQLNRLKAEIEEFEEKKSILQSKIMAAMEDRVRAQNSQTHYESKLAEESQKVKGLKDATELLECELKQWSGAAGEYCDGNRVDDPRPVEELKRMITAAAAALEEHRRAQGATVEELEEELLDAEKKYKKAVAELKEMSRYGRVLRNALTFRLNRWHDFRRHIALRTKLQFQYHLSNRGYYGKILFDHVKQMLELKVQTDDQAGTQSTEKDPRSLSGGEKSFSTICLLLSLWEAIGCPIRCLDEFDVFMDAVNRRISMKMMIETANASESKQYILITPQDMSNVAFGPSVRVHRMGDPERGQNTLAF